MVLLLCVLSTLIAQVNVLKQRDDSNDLTSITVIRRLKVVETQWHLTYLIEELEAIPVAAKL